MKKIAIATIFYQNKTELQRLADSIPPNVIDYWICLDGPFRYNLEVNPDLPHKSEDGSIATIMQSRTKFNYGVVLHYKAGSTEFDKRNTYLENCEKLGIDCLLIVDSDEYFIYDKGKTPLECWQRFLKNIELEMIKNPHHNVYGIQYIDEHGTDTYKPRIWMHPEKMRYINGSHYHYANIIDEADTLTQFKQNKVNYVQHAASIIKGGVILTQDHKLRSDDYMKKRDDYQKYLNTFEELIQSYRFSMDEAHKMAKERHSDDDD